jgi:hypothetical protein
MTEIFPILALTALSTLALITPAARAASPAAAVRSSLSLAGEWRFALDPAAEQHEIIRARGVTPPLPAGDGIAQAWFARDLPGRHRIQLPGILQAQGYGHDISPSTPWVLTLGDAWWKLQPAALRDRFSQPGHVEVPFLAQPPKHYLGVAWYQRDLDIPAAWQGRRVELFLERPHWETTAWIDDRASAPNLSVVAPHISDFGVLVPGRHRLTIRIDNRQLLRDPVNDGHALDAHSVSDALGATWNGIVGRIELRATTPVWIDDAQVFPHVAQKTALIKIAIGNATGRPGAGRVFVGDRSAAAIWDAHGGRAEIEVPLGADAQTWDEFHPVLQHLSVTLRGDDADDAKSLTFGLREVSHRDKDFLLNGRAINLRLTHFGGDFPLTGYPATDIESWKKIIRVCQDFGLNGMRFHSWCPPDAAFAAADELGFYLQPECGLWAPFNPGSVYTQQLETETARLLKAYGNHPSFITLSPSNEPAGHYQQVTPQWASAWHAKDDRRLYSAGTGWGDPAQVYGGPQYAALVRFGHNPLRNVSGWFGRDFRAALTEVHIPVLAHEIGQWCAYPDFAVIKEFTGYLRPGNYDIFRALAARQGVLADNRAFAAASGRFQLACYKEEIEANLRTPGLAGYQLLDLHDYLGQGTALIGVVDAFWKPKRYVTAAEFRRFNGRTVPLARLARRTFTTGDSLGSDVELYRFAGHPLKAAVPYWKIIDTRGRAVAGGEWPARDLASGKNIPLGRVDASLARFAAPAAYKLVVGLKNTSVENDWNFWLYPAQIDPAVPADVLVTHTWTAAAARLATGGKVLFIPGADALDPALSPPMKKTPVFWNIQMTVRPPRNPTPRFDAMLGLLCDPHHPALAEFPTESNCDWQWTPLIDNVRSINLDRAPRELRPIVAAIDDWNRDWRLGVIFECNVGPGRLLVSAIDLDSSSAPPGAQQLRRSLLDYMAGDHFQPAVTLTPGQISILWQRGTDTPAPAPHQFDRDLDDGSARPPAPNKI